MKIGPVDPEIIWLKLKKEEITEVEGKIYGLLSWLNYLFLFKMKIVHKVHKVNDRKE